MFVLACEMFYYTHNAVQDHFMLCSFQFMNKC